MYAKTKYTFYKEDGKTKIDLTENNIKVTNDAATYETKNGELYVTNSEFNGTNKFTDVSEQINICPENNVFTMGESYVIKITPIVILNETEDCEIENLTEKFDLSELKEPTIGLKMERRQLANSSKYIRIPISIGDNDGTIYGSDWGEYSLKVYRYRDNSKILSEVKIYDKFQDGTNITGNTFNLQKNATNYAVYVQEPDINYSYNYVVKIIMKYDKKNTGKNLETHTEEYTLKAINNEAEVSIGSATLVQNGTNCEIRLYDSYYNVDKIDRIEYSVFDLANNYITTSEFSSEWTTGTDDQNIVYYKTTLPVEFTSEVTYTIKMNLYAEDILVGQIDTTYIQK